MEKFYPGLPEGCWKCLARVAQTIPTDPHLRINEVHQAAQSTETLTRSWDAIFGTKAVRGTTIGFSRHATLRLYRGHREGYRRRFLAICPGLQGCYTEGGTEAEAQSLIEDAIRLHVEDRLERGEPIYEEVAVSQVKVAM